MQNYQNHQVDLSNCDREPIHHIGRIQPHGFLLVLGQEHTVEQVSQNISTFLPFTPVQLLGQPLGAWATTSADKENWESLLSPQAQFPRLLELGGQPYLFCCHASEGKLVLEAERAAAYPDAAKLHHHRLLTQLHQNLNKLEELEPMAEALAHALREVLAYDRVNVTRFDEDWHTDVVAESRNSKLPSFIGHHFPASDIPAPARALLLQKHIRQIPNVHAQAAEIFPYLNPTTGQPTNILQSEFRNPSEIHLEYIKNTGVAATISFSILVKEELWGVVPCHHVEPVYVDVWRRQVCDQMVKMFSNVISSLQTRHSRELYLQLKEAGRHLISRLREGVKLTQAFGSTSPNILDITLGQGAAICIDQKIICAGQVPTREQIQDLVSWLAQEVPEGAFYTSQLSRIWPPAEAFKTVGSGLLALEISRYNKEYLLFFKPEIKETRTWAGNPEKQERGKEGYIHPRKSFEKWVEVIQGKSQPWLLGEREVAQLFLKDLVALRLRNQTVELEVLYKAVMQNAEQLQARNGQLEDFARIISHNLRSPLANIKSLLAYHAEEPGQESASFALQHIAQVTDNMNDTIQDLNTIVNLQLTHQTLPREDVPVAEVVEKELQNLAAVVQQTSAQVQLDLQAPTVFMPKIYLESILHNLLSNALKYHSPDRQPQVLVKTWEAGGKFHLAVSDNGLGMNLKKVGDKLFGLYKVFHYHKEAKGLGLYLTRLQVKSLDGDIQVQSQEGEGTTFEVVV
ncbi:ATP-binding protein [Rufibacter quisquiliarum]|uniref:histidine kinase n=1 Tax=Rufibacter quisquiliarum TaxID=1549639 RepID=A0A839GAK6_9BACT|nr:ATP-binding protein [Rufibacter quisquiliarum]MBA9075320.1 light-regulated signal transduction histidine kinase (bacteriophytochrome) [Rufibacter quisquiliarum]